MRPLEFLVPVPIQPESTRTPTARAFEFADPHSKRRTRTILHRAIVAFCLPVSLLIGSATLIVAPALAESVLTVGNPGTAGLNGAPGSPGLPGGNGSAGQSANATASRAGEDNIAEARGGAGGQGGRGGTATASSGTNGGRGGNGGNAGDAFAQATTIAGSVARATATTGSGGAAGLGGTGSAPGIDDANGTAGLAGRTTAIADVTRDFAVGAATPGLNGLASARSGISGKLSRLSTAGDASATVTGNATGPGNATTVHTLEAFALGTDQFPLPLGGNARADATGNTTNGSLNVKATAVGGSRGLGFLSTGVGSTNSSGGGAIATATGRQSGSGTLKVEAIAKGFGGEPGSIGASANGFSTGGGDVTVTADLKQASFLSTGSTQLRNAVDGATAGNLTLGQALTSPGDAVTSLVAENTGGGSLDMTADVTAFSDTLVILPVFGRPDIAAPINTSGLFGPALVTPPIDGGRAIVGDVIGRSNTGADVSVHAIARGWEILKESDTAAGASLPPSRIAGISNGGQVTVSAEFNAQGSITTVSTPTSITGNTGASVRMDNEVDGETSGALILMQTAKAGAGATAAFAPFPAPPPDPNVTDLLGGRGGNAFNRLVHAGSHASLSVVGESRGGRGGGSQSSPLGGFSSRGGSGGTSTTIVSATNDAGSVNVQGDSFGGQGADTGTGVGDKSGHGGDAFADYRGFTVGDGHDVIVGTILDPQAPFQEQRAARLAERSAVAGSGGSLAVPRLFGPPPFDSLTGNGGNAVSRSEGTATGNSRVEVYDFAVGGAAGSGPFSPLGTKIGTGGKGGDAASQAIATGAGTSQVIAVSRAAGGGNGFYLSNPGRAGNANASAWAAGLGNVEARALATGAFAHARAEASGNIALASADATTKSALSGNFRAAVRRGLSGSTLVESSAGSGLAMPGLSAPRTDGSAFLSGQPLAADVTAATARSAALADALQARPGASVGALGQWHATGAATGISTQRVELEITLAPPTDPNGQLQLAIFELESVGGGFDQLVFGLEVAGQAFGTPQTFGTLAEANAFFASLIGLGSAFAAPNGSNSTPAIRMLFDITSRAGQSVGFGIAAAIVPEPSTATLLGIGLLLIAKRRPASSLFGDRHTGFQESALTARTG